MKRRAKIFLVTIVVLVSFRLLLPSLIHYHISQVLNDVPGYAAKVGSVNLKLLQAKYEIDSLKIYKLVQNTSLCVVEIPRMTFSLDWKSLLKVNGVWEVRMQQPTFNFVSHGFSDAALMPMANWPDVFSRLVPTKINRISVRDGRISIGDLLDPSGIRFHLDRIQMEAQNLSQTEEYPGVLPARVLLQAASIGNGSLSLSMRMDSRKPIPEMDMDLKFENIELTSLRDFFKRHGIDLVSGNLNLYAEVMATQGKFSGYVSPRFSNLKFRSGDPDILNVVNVDPWDMKSTDLYQLTGTRSATIDINIPHRRDFWPSLWNIFLNTCVAGFQRDANATLTLASTHSSKKNYK